MLARLLPLLVALLVPAGCRTDGEGEETGPAPEGDADTDGDTDADADADADADSDADTDTGPVEPFEPATFSWGFQAAVVGGALLAVETHHGTIPPLFWFTLFEQEYQHSHDERHSCSIGYRVSASTGASAPEAWLDLVLDLSEPYHCDCEGLDPERWGVDPYAIFAGSTWELAFGPLDDEVAASLAEALGEESWKSEWEPYTFGAHTWVDGEAWSQGQTHYAHAVPVVDGAVDPSGGPLGLDVVQQGGDAFLITQSLGRHTLPTQGR
jgi:hypothetical protein